MESKHDDEVKNDELHPTNDNVFYVFEATLTDECVEKLKRDERIGDEDDLSL